MTVGFSQLGDASAVVADLEAQRAAAGLVVASKQGQVEFNKHKGATLMRTDVRDQLDARGQQNLDDLQNAKVLMPGHPNDTWDNGIAAFVLDGDQDALLQVYLTAAP